MKLILHAQKKTKKGLENKEKERENCDDDQSTISFLQNWKIRLIIIRFWDCIITSRLK